MSAVKLLKKTVEYLLDLRLPPEEFSSGFFIKGTFFLRAFSANLQSELAFLGFLAHRAPLCFYSDTVRMLRSALTLVTLYDNT